MTAAKGVFSNGHAQILLQCDTVRFSLVPECSSGANWCLYKDHLVSITDYNWNARYSVNGSFERYKEGRRYEISH